MSKKIVELTKKFKFVNSYSTKKRGKTFETHLDDFLSDIDMLFNIFAMIEKKGGFKKKSTN